MKVFSDIEFMPQYKGQVELYLKFSFPFVNFMILFFCVPLASSTMRSKGRGMVFLLGILVAFLFLSMLRVGQSLGYNGLLSPIFAAWLANIVFGLLAIGFLFKAEV